MEGLEFPLEGRRDKYVLKIRTGQGRPPVVYIFGLGVRNKFLLAGGSFAFALSNLLNVLFQD